MAKIFTYILMIFIALNFAITPVFATSVTNLKKQQEEVRKKEIEAQKKLNEAKAGKKDAVSEMDEVDAQLQIVTDELDVINENLDGLNALLEKTTIEHDDAVILKAKQLDVFKKRTRYMYMNGKTGYLEVLFDSKDFSDLVNKMEYMNRVVAYDKNMAANLRKTEDLIATKLEETTKQTAEVQVLSNQQTAKMVVLEQSLNEKAAMVKRLEGDASKYENLVKTYDQSGKDIALLIKKTQDANAKAALAKNSKAKVVYSAQSAAITTPYTGGKLAWPVPSRSSISSPYGIRTNPISRKTEFHSGIDIPAPQGSAIVAADGGTVIFSGWKNGYGNTTIVDHGNGLTTLYGHASKLVATVGQTVERGETIAKVGSTGYSTGPHLHFEVRSGGSTRNPVSYVK